MYRSRLWTMRQYAGFGSARETNARFRYLLDHGQTGLSVAFDLPTQMGYASDHPLAEAEVGGVGVSINTLDDMERLLEGIPLDQVSVSMTINATASCLLAMVVAVARSRGDDVAALRGTVQNDILKEYVARGTYRFPVGPSMRLVTDLMAATADDMPRWNPISVSGYHMREAGCTAVQEVAFTLGHGLAYLEAARAAGLEPAAAASRMSFFFNAHNHLFEEVAKFRAARRMWAQLLADRFGIDDPKAVALRFHTQTAGSTLTAQEPANNAVRVAYQALAAVMGGTQSLHTNGADEALSLPTEDSARLALRTQQILAHESGVIDVADPLGGSPYVESLTDAVEEAARELLARVDALGGAVPAIEDGFPQREIQRAALDHQRSVESGDTTVVGVNAFTSDASEPEVDRSDAGAVRDEVLADLEASRSSRDGAAVDQALTALGEAAAVDDAPLFPAILRAVETRATIGEICETLERVFGRFDGSGAAS